MREPDGLEIVILSEVSQRQISKAIAYMWNLKKNGTNELIYKTNGVTDVENNLW